MLCGRSDNVVWTLYQCFILVKLPTLPQLCHNIATTLSQRWPMLANVQATLCELCGNVTLNVGDQHWDNIQARLCEHHLNVCAQFWVMMLWQHSNKVVWMLWKHCSQHWRPPLRWHLGNVVWTLCEPRCPMLGTDVETTFVVWTLVLWLAHNVHAISKQCYDNVGATLKIHDF